MGWQRNYGFSRNKLMLQRILCEAKVDGAQLQMQKHVGYSKMHAFLTGWRSEEKGPSKTVQGSAWCTRW